jgi:chorismate mutase
MSDQFMQEVQEEENSIEELEKKIQQSTGIGEAAADDMIRANEEAQAVEVDALKETVQAYQKQLEELKELYSKNSALNDEMRQMSLETTKGVQDVMKASAQALAENNNALRNVDFAKMQAESSEQLESKTKELGEQLTASLAETQQKLADLMQQSDDFAHKENVRVYRNVQAATEQLLKKQTDELKERLAELEKPKKEKITWIQILTLAAALLTLALEALDAFGILSMFLR